MTSVRKRSIARTIVLHSNIAVLLLIIILGYFWVYRAYMRSNAEMESIRSDLYQSQRDLIRGEVLQIADHIGYLKSQTIMKMRNDIRNRIYEADAEAHHLYNLYKGRIPDNEIKHLIIETLRPMRFNDNRGYYFVLDLHGVNLLFADRPEQENHSFMQMKDANGRFVARELISIAKEKGEGYYEYSWTKPGQVGTGFPKIAFVKYFEPLEIVIGTGEYLDEVEKDLQREALDWIRKIRFGNDGYVFVQSLDGTFLAHPQKELIRTKNTDFADPYDVEIGKKLRAASRNPEGGYVTYQWRKPSTGEKVSKMSYATLFSDWGWVIVTGVYLDDVEGMITERIQNYREEIRWQVAFIGIIFICVTLLSLLYTRFFSRMIQHSIGMMTEFFKKAAFSYEKIDKDAFSFREFATLGEFVNKMVDDFRSSQDELRSEKDRAQMYLDTASIMFIALNRKGNITLINRKGSDILGGREDEIIGRNWMETFIPEQDRSRAWNRFNAFMTGTDPGFASRSEFAICTLSGAVKTISWNGTALLDERRGIEGVLISADDITERVLVEEEKKILETRLAQAQKMESIGTLAGGIAHDFNNILSAIMGYADLAQQDPSASEGVRKKIRALLKSTERARELVNQILTFSRKAETRHTAMKLGPVVRDSLKMLREILPATVSISQDIENSGFIMADSTQIHQVIMNLCINAAQAMNDEGGAIDVSLKSLEVDEAASRLMDTLPGRYLKLTVSDSGQGMPPEVAERIFEPYYTTKEMGKGIGLGLSVVHGIVKNHNGNILCTSVPGKGTTFDIYLPQVEPPSENAVTGSEGPLPSGKEHILYVDDEPVLGEVASEMLGRFGYDVTVQTSSLEALRLFKGDPQKFDLVITDMTMPNMTGDRLAEEIMRLRKDVPVIICTGFSDHLSEEKAYSIGIREYLQKPVTARTMAETVRKVLDKGGFHP